MRKMKKGVVAQLIYMLVLIAIAVVVGLFFMTVVEKNKKNASENAIAEVQFEVSLDKSSKVVVKTPQEFDGNFKVETNAGSETFNKSVMIYNGFYYEYGSNLLCNTSDNTDKVIIKDTAGNIYYQNYCKNLK